MAEWLIIEQSDGLFDLEQDGGACLYDQPLDEVERYITDYGNANDVVLLENERGFRGDYEWQEAPRWRN